jgi:putative ABC transport system substrate-binding protein
MRLSALAWMLLVLTVDVSAASAQEPGRVYTIGWLWTGTPGLAQLPMEKWEGPSGVFRDTFKDAGFVLGKNLVVEIRHAHGDVSRLAAEAEALVASNVDVIVAAGTAPTQAAVRTTKRIPIVFNGVGSPAAKGLVASLSKPGGNVTGMAVQLPGAKSWQLLRDIAPATRRGGGLVDAANSFALDPAYRGPAIAKYAADATAAGIEFVDLSVSRLEEIEAAFAGLAKDGPSGVVVFTSNTLFEWRTSIVEMALRHRLPTVCLQWLPWGQAGCLVTYGEDFYAMNRGTAAMVIKVLRGAKPADIPVEQPTRFKLIINAKTAEALGLTVPTSLHILADQVIE